ncbi:hypothetical protein L7F22_039953 [Adiantum nelumboides]|nr:hypothetical protein [Adiantum nelumboides]
MVDVHSNGGSKRSPVLDLNQALTKDEEEEEERQKETLGPSWLFGKPQNPWLQSNDQDLSDRKNRTSEANPALEQHQGLSGRPYTHPAEQLGFRETSISLHNEQHDHDNSTLETQQRFQVIDIWKNNSDPTMDLTKSFPPMEDVKRTQDKPTVSLGTMWEREQAALPLIQRSLSPVSPPPTKKSLSPISPEQRPPEEIREAALRRERSPAKRGSSYHSPVRGHNSGGDAYSKQRRDRDNSMSPRTLSKKRHDRSPSPSPVVRSTRIRRSRTRSPVSRGHRYSPPRSRHSPRARHSPRRRSPVSYRPKRRPWSPPPNRNTGLGKPGRNLFIAGFSFGTTERDLERKFSRYGRVRDVRIVRDKRGRITLFSTTPTDHKFRSVEALYFPDMAFNLLSVASLDSEGADVHFGGGKVLITDSATGHVLTREGAAAQPIPILPPPSLPDPLASPVITPSTSHPVPPIQPPDVSPDHALSDSDSDLDVADATPEVDLAPPRREKRIPGWLYSTVASSGVTELPVPPSAGLPRHTRTIEYHANNTLQEKGLDLAAEMELLSHTQVTTAVTALQESIPAQARFDQVVRKAPFEIVEGGKKVPPILQTKDKMFEADKYVQNTDEAYRKIKLALLKQKKPADRHRRELVFSLGDWVLLRFEKSRLRKMKGKERLFPKLGMRNYGSFQVCDKVSDVAYRLKLPEGWKIHNAFHVSLLRPFVGDMPEE